METREQLPRASRGLRIGLASRPRLEFVVFGLDHTTAGIELRERVAFTDAEIPRALARLTEPADPLLEQAVILSTCNRVEVYGATRSVPGLDALAVFLAGYHGLDPGEISGALYVHLGDDVAHHLAATAAGMHSLVPGEAQIQGQVRAAADQALSAGTVGPELRRMFESATAASRRARSQTAVGRGVTSVAHASVELAERSLGTLSRSTVLLIGAGNTCELAAKQLVKCDVAQLLVLGRDQLRATRLAARYGGRTITSDCLVEVLAVCDVVISSTGAPAPILHRNQLERAVGLRGRGSEPLVLIDLAVPRDIDRSVTGLSGVELHTIDDLRRAVGRALDRRLAELPMARAILGVEVARFTAWLRRREAAAV